VSVYDLPVPGDPLLVIFVTSNSAGLFEKNLPGLVPHSLETNDFQRMFEIMSRDGWWYSGFFNLNGGETIYVFQREQE
jgi:hypothetical protein